MWDWFHSGQFSLAVVVAKEQLEQMSRGLTREFPIFVMQSTMEAILFL